MAQRDMTSEQFMAALKRNGFGKPLLFWVEHRDLPGIHFSIIFDRSGRIYRRETIAHLIKCRDEELAKLSRSFRQPVAA